MKLRGESIIEFCRLYFDEYERIIPNEGQKFNLDHKYLFFELMDKLMELYSGIGEMMILANSKKYLKTSLFLLVRGALLDVIQANWLFSKMDPSVKNDEDQKVLLEEVAAINRDHFVFHFSLLKKMNTLNVHLTEAEKFPIDIELSYLNNEYSYFLGKQIQDVSSFKPSDLGRTTKIANMLDENTVKDPILRNAYLNYSFYSKVEHSGILTAEIRKFNYEKNEKVEVFLDSSLKLIHSTALVLMLSFFKDTDFKERVKLFRIVEN